MTKYELSWGAAKVHPEQRRLFHANRGETNDAMTRYAEKIVELDRDERVWAGWVRLRQIEPAHFDIGWTKTSDERPTVEGEVA